MGEFDLKGFPDVDGYDMSPSWDSRSPQTKILEYTQVVPSPSIIDP